MSRISVIYFVCRCEKAFLHGDMLDAMIANRAHVITSNRMHVWRLHLRFGALLGIVPDISISENKMNPVAFFARHALSKSQKDWVDTRVSNYAEFRRTGKWTDRFQYSQTATRMSRLRSSNRLCAFARFEHEYESWIEALEQKISPRELPRFKPGGDLHGLTQTIFKGGLIKASAVENSTISGAFVLTEDRQRMKELLISGRFQGSVKEQTVVRIQQDRPGGSFHTEIGLYAKLFLISL